MASNPSSNEKVTFGAVINPIDTQNESHGHDNSLLTPNTPSSPFYALPSAQPSIQSLPSKKEPNVAVYETDLEAGRLGAPNSNLNLNLTPLTSHSALDLPPARPVASYATTAMSGFKRSKECTMWPTKETLREKAKAHRVQEQQRQWGGGLKTKWEGMTKKQRLWIRVLTLLLIVALAVGLGVGISKAVNGGVYAGKGQTKTIPNST